MFYYSTNNKKLRVSLQEAVSQGLAPDNGLYLPEYIPVFDKSFIDSIHEKSFYEIALSVSELLIGDDVPKVELERIIKHTIQFDAPVVRIADDIYVLELFHGPTLAFKDFGARFMSQLLSYFSKSQDREIVILVATSGDTGSAVANGFLGVEGTKVVVLYPSGKVSEVQEKQFTTLGKNITALEVNGTFDDCQQLVKQAFLDEEIRSQLLLTSANSINIARLIPQSFYYFYAYAQMKHLNKPLVFSVPSGNFGNLTGGLFAKKMGLPVEHFVAATNVNDIVPEYLNTKVFSPRVSKQTISNAMDVGNPSNFARMLDLYENNFEKLTADIVGKAFTDDQTKEAIVDVFLRYGYTMDPHGAIGYLGLKDYMNHHKNVTGVFFETAHPGKFGNVVEDALKRKISLPETLLGFMKKDKLSVKISNQFEDFKQFIVSAFK